MMRIILLAACYARTLQVITANNVTCFDDKNQTNEWLTYFMHTEKQLDNAK